MRLTVLLDNNTLIDRYFLGEPGVSYLIEDRGKKILFDVGYSDAFITNARKMKIDLLQNDFIILSHGHLDHTWGLDPLIKLYTEAVIESIDHTKPELITHPNTFYSKSIENLPEIGSDLSEKKLARHFKLSLSKKPLWITDNLVFLGEIKRTNKFENVDPVGTVHHNGHTEDDYLIEDSAIAYTTKNDEVVVITGCSHAGICNIIEQAKRVTGQDKILDVIGGFHLQNPSKEQLEGTLDYFNKMHASVVHPCHCVDLASKIELAKVSNVEEVGVGLVLNYE